ncbi:MAG TPA: hypothetical protein VJV04_02195 [Nitrospiraceae bacterium]|nr:hypothetical protein [Nitrospiraceae bacterium]
MFIRVKSNPIDRPVLWFSDEDALTMRMLLDGGVIILGRPGSGKTSSSGNELALGILLWRGDELEGKNARE